MLLMNRIFLFLSLAFTGLFISCQSGFSQKSGKGGKGFAISGHITQTHAYCGGARPSEEMLKSYTTPKPFPGKKLYIRSGTENSLKKKVLREVIADSAGHFSLRLPPGTYCIIQEEQVKKLDPEHFRQKANKNLKLNEECLKQWWDKCFMTFEVKDADKSDLNINFYIPCFTEGIPCMQYTGPMPP
jgi:hypothetical protein